MTDPKQDVRQQFEAWAVENGLRMDRYCSIDFYIDTDTERTWQGYQAALQSPAVRELVEAIEQYRSDYRTTGCPKPDCFVCARSNAAEARLIAALRTLGAGHVE